MKTILQIIRVTFRIAIHLLWVGLVAVAIGLSVVRFWLLPQAPQWRDALQAQLAVMTGETVRVKSLAAEMRGLRPELTVRGLRIENADGPALEFERLGVGLDAVQSLRTRQPVIKRIELDGAHLRLLRLADGTFALAGLKSGGSPPAWLFAEGEVRFADIDLELAEADGGPAMPLGRIQARLRNQGPRHLFDARLDLPGKLGKSVRFSADIAGNPLAGKDWQGKGYVEAKRLREGAFAESLPVRLRSGEIGLQAWGEWHGGVFRGARGRIDFERPVFTWRRGEGQPDGMLAFDKLAGGLRWQQEAEGWRLDVKRFALGYNGKAWPETDFALALAPDADGGVKTLRAAVSYLRLDDVLSLLGGMPLLEEQQREALKTVSPHGEIRNARLVYQAEGRVGFCGDLLGLSFKLSPDLPGPNRFNGHLCGNDRDGRMDVDLAKTELNLPGLYPKPLAVDALSGRFAWHRVGGGPLDLFPPPEPPPPLAYVPPPTPDIGPPAPPGVATVPIPPPEPPPPPKPRPNPFAGSGWQWAGNQIKLAVPGLTASGGFAFNWPTADGASADVDMDAQFLAVDAARIRDYLPVTLMHPDTAKWHSEAYVSGQVSQANVRLRGRLADFPFAQNEGVFEASIATENLELNFNPQWPHLYGMKSTIVLSGPRLTVDTVGGKLGDIPLQPVHAEAPTLSGDAWVSISSGMDIELGAALKFLQQTAARSIPQRLGKAFEASGPARLDMKIMLPLGAGDLGMEGRLQLQNDTLALKPVNLKVTDLVGELAFTGNGVEGKQLTAKVMDEPLLIDVGHNQDDILFDIGGNANVPALRKVFPGDLWQHAEGAFGYRLNLQMAKTLDASAPLRVDFASDLIGLELKLPAPLVKSPTTKKDFTASAALRRGGNTAWRVSYGREGAARLLFSQNGLEGADLFWNVRQTPANWETGLGLHLKLDTLDAGVWRRFLSANGASPGPMTPRVLDVNIDTLLWNGENLDAIRLSGKREGDEFWGRVECLYGKGNFTLVDTGYGHSALGVELEYLNLPKLPDGKDGQASIIDPAKMPELQVHASHLYREGADLGELDLQTERWASGMGVKLLTLASGNHELTAKGSWLRQDGRSETRLDGRLKVRDLGNLLATLGHDKEITRTPTEAVFALNWPGAPQQFSAAGLGGEINLKLGRGSVLQVEPGLGRALGMLNLQTLRRLLQMDFSDLFGKGLAYDGMEGTFTLAGGQARTNSFVIDAVAADILLIGRVGLADHDLDQAISVMPHPFASIPLAGPMLGGAAVGAVIDIAHRLVGAENANLASSNYVVTGPWSDPQIKRVEGAGPVDIINKAWRDLKRFADMGDGRSGEAPE
ncbi:MAG: YhdP family protein [Candidatus Methylumidiphilus sp.]